MKIGTLISFACTAAAFQYPDFVPLHKRQEPGTPQYECHANCGGIITASRTDGYCDTSDFKSELSDCLDCALVYDIWKYYGDSVSSAAEECGLDATPVEPSSSSVAVTSTETEASASEAAESTTVSSPVIPTGTATTTPTDSGSSASSTPTPSDPQYTGAAAIKMPGKVTMGALMGSFIAALVH
ncbi:hypothetical protein BDV18DRAFT_135600 [Aspergillus unguis]